MKKNTIDKKYLYKSFANRVKITTKELYSCVRKKHPHLNNKSAHWHISVLKKKGLIVSQGRGFYSLKENTKKTYVPPKLKKSQVALYKKIKKEFPFISICIWPFRWLLEFTHHLPNINWTIIEVDKEVLQSVMSFIKSTKQNVFMNPSQKEIEHYLNSESIIVKNLISQAPLIKKNDVIIPKIEKILVDLYADKVTFNALQGNELIYVFEKAFELYQINIPTLKRYSLRRNHKDNLLKFIANNTQIDL